MATGVAPSRAQRPSVRLGRGWISFLLVALLTLLPTPARAGQPARVPGIDVSKWQGDIDWAAVASTRIRYVIMRSTIGDTGSTPLSVDPRYGEYLAGATANGLVVGAYHRANVGRADGDAEEEADFFVDLSQIEAGDVIPVIDIEETHGLTVLEMQAWVRAWVKRVYARTGVRPMVYSSPSFWRTNMGDATWFATNGDPLWIAHWGVDDPDVPAQGWDGRGWTYWQWTSTGSVDGISTAVDRDRYEGSNLIHGRIASVTVTPSAGGAVTGARIRCGSGDIRCGRLANPDTTLLLTAEPDPDAILLGWHGACAGAGTSPSCNVVALGHVAVSATFGYPLSVELAGSGGGTVTSSPGGIDCLDDCAGTFPAGSTVTLEADPDSASAFEGWGGACAGTDPTCAVEVSAVTDVTASFVSVVSVEEDGPGTSYTWGRAEDERAIGGSYRWDRRAGASTTFAFSGGAVTLSTMSGRAMGKASVAIDGVVVATLDGYAPALTRSKIRFDGLATGPHELTVTALGTKRAVARGTRVAVDALRWGGRLLRDPTAVATTWGSIATDDGAAAITEAPRATARLRFEGTGVSARVVRGPTMGRAELWIDGAFVRTVDLYAATPRSSTLDVALGLADGPHVAKLIVLGTHRAASGGAAVGLDAWVIR
jgi:GH25 family lysozyme M1 (1,4-beta-N-acetylmuramidase)